MLSDPLLNNRHGFVFETLGGHWINLLDFLEIVDSNILISDILEHFSRQFTS